MTTRDCTSVFILFINKTLMRRNTRHDVCKVYRIIAGIIKQNPQKPSLRGQEPQLLPSYNGIIGRTAANMNVTVTRNV